MGVTWGFVGTIKRGGMGLYVLIQCVICLFYYSSTLAIFVNFDYLVINALDNECHDRYLAASS